MTKEQTGLRSSKLQRCKSAIQRNKANPVSFSKDIRQKTPGQEARARFVSQDGHASSTQQKTGVAGMGISHRRAIVADLVSDPRHTKALAGDLSLPARGSAACEWFRSLDYGADRLGFGIP